MESSEAQPRMEERERESYTLPNEKGKWLRICIRIKKELEKPWYIEKLWSQTHGKIFWVNVIFVAFILCRMIKGSS